jgi:perosamine synthetase
MITTDNRELYEKALSYRSLCCRIYGGSYKYLPIDETRYPMGHEYWRLQFDDFGYNFRMTDAQAAVGIEQLKKLDGFNARRIELAASLSHKLERVSNIILPYEDPQGKHVYHFYVLQLAPGHPLSKVEMMWQLYTRKGIKAWNHYLPIHLTEPYRRQSHREGECPVAERAHDYFFSLPIHPRMDEPAIEYMADCVAELSR